MSLNQSIAHATVNAMHGAVLGQAIGEARSRAYEAEARVDAVMAQLHESRNRCRQLDRYVAALEARVRELSRQTQ